MENQTNEVKKEEELSTQPASATEAPPVPTQSKNMLSVPMAIIVAGVLIAGAIYFSSVKRATNNPENGVAVTALAPISKEDRVLGNPKAKVTLVMYEDFQCPFCGVIAGHEEDLAKSLQQRDPSWTPFIPEVMKYVENGQVKFVYRDWAFLGRESVKSAEAARCAGDQGKFWEYHDYLFSHQNGENQGAFSDPNLKSFAKILGLESASFDQCLDSGKYTQAVADSQKEGMNAGVNGTPKGFILKGDKVVSTVDGAESWTTVKPKIDNALK